MSLTRRGLILGAAAAVPLGALALSRREGSAPSVAPEGPRRGREVERIVTAQRTSDGAGVNLNRILGGRELPMLDPTTRSARRSTITVPGAWSAADARDWCRATAG